MVLLSCTKGKQTENVLKPDEVLQSEFLAIAKGLDFDASKISLMTIKGIKERYGSFESWKNVYQTQKKLINSKKSLLKKGILTQSFTPSVFKIHLVNESYGLNFIFNIREDVYLLDAAEEAGLELPFSDRAGASTTCAMRCLEGDISDPEQTALNEAQKDEGYFLSCVAYVASDAKAKTHVEEELY